MKPLTNEELQQMDGILPEDKELITKIVNEAVGLGNDIRVRAIRGYLAGQLLELVVDAKLREALTGDAANFDDGWTAALEYASKVTSCNFA